MFINEILNKIDELLNDGKIDEAENLMIESIREAAEKNLDDVVLSLENELIGFYREASRYEDGIKIANAAMDQAEKMGITGTIAYATTLLNIASLYRGADRLNESMIYFENVRKIYDTILEPGSLLYASLENNLALLYEEKGLYDKAKDSLLRALAIVKDKNAIYEIAVSYANLANVSIELGQLEEGREYAITSMDIFEKQGVYDSHMAAANAALGNYYFKMEKYDKASARYGEALNMIRTSVGETKFYYRVKERLDECAEKMGPVDIDEILNNESLTMVTGLSLCKDYYYEYGEPMIKEKFPEYVDRIATGLVGEGSDCFGMDDEYSRDHDWGPGFCIWVTDEVYEKIGKDLEAEYAKLPMSYKGFFRLETDQGAGRRGVMTINRFYERFLGTSDYDDIKWQYVSDASLAAAVNGEVFTDPEGQFSEMRNRLKSGYPEEIRYLKIDQSAAMFSQTGQYNYERMLKRGDIMTAQLLLADSIREAMKLQYYIENKYPLHDKWLRRGLSFLENGNALEKLLEELVLKPGEEKMEEIAEFFVGQLYSMSIISDIEPYLDRHSDEIFLKANLVSLPKKKIIEGIVKLEFEEFDKVQNEGGRASCQDNFPTFNIMRSSQYMTWDKTMLMQYVYDFDRESRKGHNLITEKYGRMEQSTAPEEYEKIKDNFPEISPEKQAIIDAIVKIQVDMMDAFAEKYPKLAGNARSIHAFDDRGYNTSYETYLKGEISTYSDKMLELYGRYVARAAAEGENLAMKIMENNVKMYGYESLEDAESKA
ncbi:MAG: DUF4125 family protein [Acetatifactor sp.]|nr:DUF4125 family protein [Acetatifactor sp.]